MSKYVVLGSVQKYLGGEGAGQNWSGQNVLSCPKGGGQQVIHIQRGKTFDQIDSIIKF